MSISARPTTTLAMLWRLGGEVQGIGFRPHVWRVATACGVSGWVCNDGQAVSIYGCGSQSQLDDFIARVIQASPGRQPPALLEQQPQPARTMTGFSIQPSQTSAASNPAIPQDHGLCERCRHELFDPANRRHRYPFIACAQCGPRYTVIDRLPYDRHHTRWANFPLCPACQAEYDSPEGRRFHAESISCPSCGPQLSFQRGHSRDTGTVPALAAAVDALRQGGIVAVKGLGGYHLMCLAEDNAAVARLRQRKHRPHKPFAVLMPWRGPDGLDAVREWGVPDTLGAQRLRDPARPIVLLPATPHCPLEALAPGLGEIGLMLPANGIQELLLQALGQPLLVTSANRSGEPIIIDNVEAERRLVGIADAMLHHDLPLLRSADDAVYRQALPGCPPLRLGRGNSPLGLPLPSHSDQAVLALGAQQKLTLAIGQSGHAIITPHLGDLTSPSALERMEQLAETLITLSGITPTRLCHDTHPDMISRHWAGTKALPTQPVHHHRAHASALYGEQGMRGEAILFCWDGTGLGTDHTLWGGEVFVGQPGHWRRVSTLRPFRLPGGELAAREPWRSAAALCWATGTPLPAPPPNAEVVHQAWRQHLNCPTSSAVGRLFDAAAYCCGFGHTASHEGQAAMWLEAQADTAQVSHVTLPHIPSASDPWQIDWQPLLSVLLDTNRLPSERAAIFHNSLAQAVIALCHHWRTAQGIEQVGLAGGVFQNALLTSRILQGLAPQGFQVHTHQHLPCNDAAISYGQLIEAISS